MINGVYNKKEDLKDIDFDVYNAGARLYNPYIGIFLECDRFANIYSQWNPYNFTANNPIKYVDINGDSIAPPTMYYGEANQVEIIIHAYSQVPRGFLQQFEQMLMNMGLRPFDQWRIFEDPAKKEKVNGDGIAFTAEMGQEKENRSNEKAAVGPNIDLLMRAYGAAKAANGVPISHDFELLDQLVNSYGIGSDLRDTYDETFTSSNKQTSSNNTAIKSIKASHKIDPGTDTINGVERKLINQGQGRTIETWREINQ